MSTFPKIEFFPKSHRYKVNGEWYPSVTGILGIIDKPNLKYWYVQQTIKYIRKNYNELVKVSEESAQKIITDAVIKGDEAKDLAADMGKLGHKVIELKAHGIDTETAIIKAFQSVEYATQGLVLDVDITETLRGMIAKFIDWCREVDFQLIHSELPLASVIHRYAGTTDFIAKIRGKKCVADLKTGKRIYPLEMGKQLAAYRIAYQEMYPGEILEGMEIVRIGFEAKDFENKLFDDKIEFLQDGFLTNLSDYKWHKQAEKLLEVV